MCPEEGRGSFFFLFFLLFLVCLFVSVKIKMIPNYKRERRPRMKETVGLVVNGSRKLQRNFRKAQDFL